MSAALDSDSLLLLIVLVLPGLVSMQAYRLLMPSKELEWSDSLLQAFFYGSVNFAVLFPFVLYALSSDIGWFEGWVLTLAILFIGPVMWPWIVVQLFRSEWVAERIKIPYPSTWDYFFDGSPSVFLIVHLNNGEVIGGLWSTSSHAGQYPHDGDLYIEELYELDDDGTFVAPIPYTAGLLIRRDQYTHLEIFRPQNPDSQDDA